MASSLREFHQSITTFINKINGWFTQCFMWVTAKARRVFTAYIASQLLAIPIFTHVEHWSAGQTLWWGTVASLTIGYGDIAPKTDLGRIIATPFHYFWVLYCTLALGGHLAAKIFKNMNLFTNAEQEWLFRVVTMMFYWLRWLVMVQVTNPGNRQLPPLPYANEIGELPDCPPQAPENEDVPVLNTT